jgi:4-hydroxy-tetrahydrodipicolinate reductase
MANSLQIALIGYGKMGRAIEEMAQMRGHRVVLRIGGHNRDTLTTDKLREADVAIEFSRPDAAFDNLRTCFEAGIPVVCGTTAWLERLDEAKRIATEYNSALFYAANYSIGVNIFMEINRRLASLMNQHANYDVSLREIHHAQKLDAPSGTGIKLAQDIIALLDRKNGWTEHDEPKPDEVSIISERYGDVPGTHIINYESAIDELEIRHTAKNRQGFASGALAAAEWLVGKKGYFEMKDLLSF